MSLVIQWTITTSQRLLYIVSACVSTATITTVPNAATSIQNVKPTAQDLGYPKHWKTSSQLWLSRKIDRDSSKQLFELYRESECVCVCKSSSRKSTHLLPLTVMVSKRSLSLLLLKSDQSQVGSRNSHAHFWEAMLNCSRMVHSMQFISLQSYYSATNESLTCSIPFAMYRSNVIICSVKFCSYKQAAKKKKKKRGKVVTTTAL